MLDTENYIYSIVERTAKHGLDEAKADHEKFRFWLAVWALDIVNETLEMRFSNNLDQILSEGGDVVWGVAAIGMLLGIEEDHIFRGSYEKVPVKFRLISKFDDLVYEASKVSDKLKKIARDDRQINKVEMAVDLTTIAYQLRCCLSIYGFTLYQAIEATDRKLRQRYPDGFSAEASINRTI